MSALRARKSLATGEVLHNLSWSAYAPIAASCYVRLPKDLRVAVAMRLLTYGVNLALLPRAPRVIGGWGAA